jgi:hypothetical protein
VSGRDFISFSGGQTSGYMLWKLLQQYPDFDKRFTVIFENTGREHDATLDFIRDVEKYWSVPVVWLEYCRVKAAEIDPLHVKEGKTRTNLAKAQESGDDTHWWRQVTYETAKRRFMTGAGPFDELLAWASVLPNVRSRMCSVQLKTRTRDRYLYAQGVREFYSYLGIRQDEDWRVAEILANIRSSDFESPQFPLVDGVTTKAIVDKFWDEQPFRLEIPNYLGNCDFCFLKSRSKRLKIAKLSPNSLVWWSNWENRRAETATGDGYKFDRRMTVAQFLEAANQPELALGIEADDEDVPCSCTIGGYRGRNSEDSEEAPSQPSAEGAKP